MAATGLVLRWRIYYGAQNCEVKWQQRQSYFVSDLEIRRHAVMVCCLRRGSACALTRPVKIAGSAIRAARCQPFSTFRYAGLVRFALGVALYASHGRRR